MSAGAPAARPLEESALVIRVPEAETYVAATRQRFDRSVKRAGRWSLAGEFPLGGV